ncbi:MAG: DUF4428 domain-containing protein [Fastidiosipilaceae bacterium]|jgi:hypothetical protein|nr:DUF4428 domain-containing protein [Clostridiaceae bacterium]
MGLFDKKYCDVCGQKIGLLGNRKLEDGNMCKDCAKKLSPFMTDRRRTGLAEIKEHLAYREANRDMVAAFNVSRTLGDNTHVLLDEDSGHFIVTSSSRWREENPDVIPFSQVTNCSKEIRESKTEIKRKGKDGKEISYNPPRYDIDYDFYITINVNLPWFEEIQFKINNRRVDKRSSVEFKEVDRQADEIVETLMKQRQNVRDEIVASRVAGMAQTCPLCGATTVPDEQGRCEYCRGAMLTSQ